jgi:hypothetical protein
MIIKYFDNDEEIMKKFVKSLVIKEYKKDSILFN